MGQSKPAPPPRVPRAANALGREGSFRDSACLHLCRRTRLPVPGRRGALPCAPHGGGPATHAGPRLSRRCGGRAGRARRAGGRCLRAGPGAGQHAPRARRGDRAAPCASCANTAWASRRSPGRRCGSTRCSAAAAPRRSTSQARWPRKPPVSWPCVDRAHRHRPSARNRLGVHRPVKVLGGSAARLLQSRPCRRTGDATGGTLPKAQTPINAQVCPMHAMHGPVLQAIVRAVWRAIPPRDAPKEQARCRCSG